MSLGTVDDAEFQAWASRVKGKIKSVPELEEELLPYAKFDSMYNLYKGFATVRII